MEILLRYGHHVAYIVSRRNLLVYGCGAGRENITSRRFRYYIYRKVKSGSVYILLIAKYRTLWCGYRESNPTLSLGKAAY
jgi:hypothetical protein